MTDDQYEIPIDGYTVTGQDGDSDVTLTLRRDSDEAELSFAPEAAALVHADGGTQPYAGFDWLGAVVAHAEESSGHLTVRFENTSGLHVAPLPRVESWQVITPEGMFFGTPG